MDKPEDMCSCGWKGESFTDHHKEAEVDDQVHVETSPLLEVFIQFIKKIDL